MKIVLAGGSGHLGQLLISAFGKRGHHVTVLSRTAARHAHAVAWDGRSLGSWSNELHGADAVINLAGHSVNCRYTDVNLRAMMNSRVDSTRAIGRAIEQSTRPPQVWLQMSTATIYAHRFDADNDEHTGRIGGDEPDVPRSWRNSIEIAKAWEAALQEANAPTTRKVALRTAMVMSTQPGGVFDVLAKLTRVGLGGAMAGGQQFVSWVHARDFVRAVEFLLVRDDLEGAVDLAAPEPLPQGEFMAALRQAYHQSIGLPASRWMLEVGAFALRTESELVLKSRRVVPRRLLEAGFTFDFPTWSQATTDLAKAAKAGRVEPD